MAHEKMVAKLSIPASDFIDSLLRFEFDPLDLDVLSFSRMQ